MTEIQEIPLITMIENPLISGFISVKIQEAKSKGIEVTHYCRYPDVTIKIPEYVLIEMMGILLDNAIEATENLEHKKIKINMTLLDNVFDFSVVCLRTTLMVVRYDYYCSCLVVVSQK